MKNIFIIKLITALILISGQLIAQDCIPPSTSEQPTAQNTCGDTGNGDIREAYYSEIECRFTNNSINSATPNNPWLIWNGEKGEFDCTGLLTTIESQLTKTNFVILNDSDYYDTQGRTDRDIVFDSNSNGTIRNRSHWPKEYFDYVTHPVHIPGIQFFLLTPGDYRDYENLFIHHAGTAEHKKYLLYYDGDVNDDRDDIIHYFNNHLCEDSYNPVNQEEQAIIERFHIPSIPENPSIPESPTIDGNWVISGITIRGNHYSYPDDSGKLQTGGIMSDIRASGNNVIKSCLFENLTGAQYTTSGGDIRNHGAFFIYIENSDNNIITGCTFREKNECINASYTLVDMMGIFLQGGYLGSSNNMIFDNDMKDVGDAIQLMPSSYCKDGETTGAPGTLIYNNRLYNEKFYTRYVNESTCEYERMNGEGAIDLKMGAGPWGYVDDLEQIDQSQELGISDKVIIAKNYISGWRGSMDIDPEKDVYGGNGEAIIIHSNAKNIVIIDNEITDCTTGINIGGGISGRCYDGDNVDLFPCSKVTIEHIEIYDNKICGLYPTVSQYNGTCLEDNNVKSIGIRVGNNRNIKVVGNGISDTVHGIFMEGKGGLATITDNYMNNIHRELFDSSPTFSGFKGNTYENFNSACVANTDNNTDEFNFIIEQNCFLCTSGTLSTNDMCNLTCP